MAQSTAPVLRHQIAPRRDPLPRAQGLPCLELLSQALVEHLCRQAHSPWRNRTDTPWITPGLFLSQVLAEGQAGAEAGDRLPKSRSDRGLPAVSPETSSSCEARQRLPEPRIWGLVRRTGQTIPQRAHDAWLFHGRAVKIRDGSTVLMPDTPEDPAAYPQPKSPAPGVGFPIARRLVVFRLAVGTVLEAAMGPDPGKQTSELALLRQISAPFPRGDIAWADRAFCSYGVIAAWQARGVDVLVRLHQCRTADFRRGRRRGREDHRVTWPKPQQVPAWMSRAADEAMPAHLAVRALRVRVKDKTQRVRTPVIVTTLVDAKAYRARELGALFRQRWHAELDLRSLKSVMEMEMLRTKSPEMVRKEVAVHLLGYNLIRGIMAAAGRAGGVQPRRLSDTGALHTIRTFEEDHLYDPVRMRADLPRLLELIVQKRVGDRPDRYEPRAVKRRPKPHPLLRMPREEAQALIGGGIIPYSKA